VAALVFVVDGRGAGWAVEGRLSFCAAATGAKIESTTAMIALRMGRSFGTILFCKLLLEGIVSEKLDGPYR
jgi:hypothetical protein